MLHFGFFDFSALDAVMIKVNDSLAMPVHVVFETNLTFIHRNLLDWDNQINVHTKLFGVANLIVKC